jgi:hypothetical protein
LAPVAALWYQAHLSQRQEKRKHPAEEPVEGALRLFIPPWVGLGMESARQAEIVAWAAIGCWSRSSRGIGEGRAERLLSFLPILIGGVLALDAA